MADWWEVLYYDLGGRFIDVYPEGNPVDTIAGVFNLLEAGKELFTSIITMGQDLIQIIYILPIPDNWLLLLSLMLTMVALLRVYAFINDVSILGFKI